MSVILRLVVAGVFLCLVSGLLAAETTPGQLRAKFEGAVETEEEEFEEKTKTLQNGYVAALGRLKDTLGRDGKLEQAAQVLSEIDALSESGEVGEIPENADYRFKRIRATWEHERRKFEEAYSSKLLQLGHLYVKALDSKKQAYSREGKIREALVIDEELNRMKEWELAEKERFKEASGRVDDSLNAGNLEEYLENKVFSYTRKGAGPKKVRFEEKGMASYGEDLEVKIRWRQVPDSFTVVLTMPDARDIEIEISNDGKSFSGKLNDGQRRRGRLLKDE